MSCLLRDGNEDTLVSDNTAPKIFNFLNLSYVAHTRRLYAKAGADPGFSLGGGGGGGGGAQKILWAQAHYERGTKLTFGMGPLKGPGSSRVVLMLSRAIWALFLSVLIAKKTG